jgi:hypothetical protein
VGERLPTGLWGRLRRQQEAPERRLAPWVNAHREEGLAEIGLPTQIGAIAVSAAGKDKAPCSMGAIHPGGKGKREEGGATELMVANHGGVEHGGMGDRVRCGQSLRNW